MDLVSPFLFPFPNTTFSLPISAPRPSPFSSSRTYASLNYSFPVTALPPYFFLFSSSNLTLRSSLSLFFVFLLVPLIFFCQLSPLASPDFLHFFLLYARSLLACFAIAVFSFNYFPLPFLFPLYFFLLLVHLFFRVLCRHYKNLHDV